MKECPFCKAEIEDNARFCLYCMKPLEEKQVIVSPKKRLKLWLPITFALIIVILLIAVFRRPTDSTPTTQSNDTTGTTAPSITQTPEESVPPEESAPPEDSVPPEDSETPENSEPPENSETPENSEPPEDSETPENSEPPEDSETPENSEPPLSCEHNYQLLREDKATCTADGSSLYLCKLCGDYTQQTSPAVGHNFIEATCTSPRQCTRCGRTEGVSLTHDYQDDVCIRCGEFINSYTDSVQDLVFKYRLAEPGDELVDEGYVNPGNEIVITRISGELWGSLIIPPTINGMQVIGIGAKAMRILDTCDMYIPPASETSQQTPLSMTVAFVFIFQLTSTYILLHL